MKALEEDCVSHLLSVSFTAVAGVIFGITVGDAYFSHTLLPIQFWQGPVNALVGETWGWKKN